MTRLSILSPVAFSLLLAAASAAQPTAVPGASADEDLEVPAAPSRAPAPAAPSLAPPAPSLALPAAPPASPAPRDAPIVAAPSVASVPSGSPDAAWIAELERRLAALEQQSATRDGNPPAPVVDEKKKGALAHEQQFGDAPANSTLSPSPYSQPMPVGFTIGGYLQVDYLHSQASKDQLQQTSVPVNQNRFYLRRARLRIDRGWEYAAATLDFDANTVGTPTVGIRRAEGSIFYQGRNPKDLPPLVAVTAGITDLPFGYEQFESERAAPFTERSLISSAIFPTKQDAAVKVAGAVSFFRYAFAVSNGEPVTASGFPRDPNDAKDVTGRIGVVVPVRDSVEVTGGASFAQGKGFHPGSAATKGGLQWIDSNENGVVDQGEIVGSFPSAAEASKNFNRWAFGLDLGVRLRSSIGETHAYGEIIAASNYDRGFLVSDPDGVASGDVRQLGGYAAITQGITRYGIVGFRVSVYDPNADIFETRHGKLEPKTQTVRTLSPMVGINLPGRARFIFQYDFVHDYLGRSAVGVPTDARNDVYIGRLQVDL